MKGQSGVSVLDQLATPQRPVNNVLRQDT
jgi:hypothetical protein